MVQEIESVSRINDAMLAEITSFDDALALINEHFGGEVVEIDKVLGTGFAIADEKAAFIGEPFVVLAANSHNGDHGLFWSLTAVTKNGRKCIINDGGTGIAAQMSELADRHPELFTIRETDEGKFPVLAKPMLVKRGLRESRYNHPEHGPSVTYYLDTAGV